MDRRSFFFRCVRCFFLIAFAEYAGAQSDPIDDAVEALRRGDVTGAEQTLRSELRARAENSEALGVLAVVLDQQSRYAEADEFYRQALALSPRSTPLLNNYGNHLLANGKVREARDVFLRVIAMDPAHRNAMLQLARIAVQLKAPVEALRYLDRPELRVQQPREVEITRMQALYELGRNREAEAILTRLSANSDRRLNYSLAMALAAAGEYVKAEDYFSRVLEAEPDNFDVLYNLGLAAAHAGHNDRARDILQSALRRQPNNVDVLYDLAAVNAKLGRQETAVQLLAQAARLNPDRSDVQQLLARMTAEMGYFGDAIRAWDSYLKLVPSDDTARRERAFAATAIGDDMEGGVAELRAFVSHHPHDAVGHYELGIAEASGSPEDALIHLNRAVALRPNLTAAVIARGLLELKQAKYVAALSDFKAAAQSEPENPVVLDRLGQTYMALDRPHEAIPILKKAAEIAPRDSKTLLHLGRALTNAGLREEAKSIFARVRELGPDQSAKPHPAGLIDFLSLSSQDQLARYRAGVERTIQRNPANAEAQVRYLKLLLADHNDVKAASVAQDLIDLAPSGAILAEAGNAALGAAQYDLARRLLEKAIASNSSNDAMLNLAIATSRAVSPQSGLEQMDRMPQAWRTGDYYLARAQMFDLCGRTDDATRAIKQAVRENPRRADLYAHAAGFLIRNGEIPDLLALLDRGLRAAPDDPEILLIHAAVLEAAGKTRGAAEALRDVERHWPDWHNVWLARAIVAAWQGEEHEARQMMETAILLGADNAEQRFARAVDFGGIRPDDKLRAARLIQALFPQ